MGSSRMMWSTAEIEVADAGVMAAPRAEMGSADDDAAGEDCADST